MSSTTPQRKLAVEPVESSSSTKRPRRFAPEQIEASTRTTRKPHSNPNDPTPSDHQTPRQPQNPGESKTKNGSGGSNNTPRRKFAPQPLEVTERHHHHSNKHARNDQTDSDADDDTAPLLPHERLALAQSKPAGPRKFSPQLIETAKRSRKSGDASPAVLPHDKTNVSPGESHKFRRPDPSPLPPSNTPVTSSLKVPGLKPLPNRQGSLHPHYPTRNNTRSRSYKVPELDSIDSSESEESEAASAHSNGSDTSNESYKHATRLRESVDENVSGYLLALAARVAEKQLREQAAAAFPNSDIHEPVAHFINRSDSETEVGEPAVTRRGVVQSTRRDSGDEKLALIDLQRHGERVLKEKRTMKKTRGFDIEFDSEPMHQDAWITGTAGSPWAAMAPPKSLIGGLQRDSDVKKQRNAARPPMLGGTIEFPRCASPEFARFDVTQGADFLRKSLGYAREDSETNTHLWNHKRKTKGLSPAEASTPTNKKPGGARGGLWGGHCTAKDAKPPPMPAGLVTPLRTPARTPCASPMDTRREMMSELPTEPSETQNGRPPPSPPSSSNGSQRESTLFVLDARLELEAKVENEFGDEFVTQVYNYLSLGYPSLARKFDEELSRISCVGIEELRMDDRLTDHTRGYIRLGDDAPGSHAIVDEDMCRRWRALKIYVREWGRQMVKKEQDGHVIAGDPRSAWGMPVRRGSWGN